MDLSIIEGGGLPCILTSLMNPRKDVDFFSIFGFSLVKVEWSFTESFHAELGTRSISYTFKKKYQFTFP